MDSATLDIIRSHVHLYADQARHAVEQRRQLSRSNALPETPRVAFPHRKLESYISVGLRLFGQIESDAESIQSAIDSGEIPYDPVISDAFVALINLWLQPGKNVEAAIQWFEEHGQPIRNAASFRECVKKAKLQGEVFSRSLAAADERMRQGLGVSLTEALRDLQPYCRPRSI